MKLMNVLLVFQWCSLSVSKLLKNLFNENIEKSSRLNKDYSKRELSM